MRLKNPNKTTHCDRALLCMNFLIMNSSSQKGILCAHYYHQHGIKMLFGISHLLLTKTLANESNKASVKIRQRNSNSWVMNEISCCVCHSPSLQRSHNTHPSTSDMHELIRSKTHQIGAPFLQDRTPLPK